MGADLTKAVLVGVQLAHTDFRASTLLDARFNTADLRGADFSQANAIGRLSLAGRAPRDRPVTFIAARLAGARFDDSFLPGAKFQSADLRDTSFRNADLSGAKFDGACVTGARFRGAVLASARLGAAGRNVDFGGAILRDAHTNRELFPAGWERTGNTFARSASFARCSIRP